MLAEVENTRSRLEAASSALDDLRSTVSRCEERLAAKEAALEAQLSALDASLRHAVGQRAAEQRDAVRIAIRYMLSAISQEEARRLELERGHELRRKRAELAWREKLLELRGVLEGELQRASQAHREQLARLRHDMLFQMNSAAIKAQVNTGHVSFDELTQVAKQHAVDVGELRRAHAAHEASASELRHRLEVHAEACTAEVAKLGQEVAQLHADAEEAATHHEAAYARMQAEALHESDRFRSELAEAVAEARKGGERDEGRLAAAAAAVREAAAPYEPVIAEPPPRGDDHVGVDVAAVVAAQTALRAACGVETLSGAPIASLFTHLEAPIRLAQLTLQRARSLSERAERAEASAPTAEVGEDAALLASVSEAEKRAARLEVQVDKLSRALHRRNEAEDQMLLRARAEAADLRERLKSAERRAAENEAELERVRKQLDS